MSDFERNRYTVFIDCVYKYLTIKETVIPYSVIAFTNI